MRVSIILVLIIECLCTQLVAQSDWSTVAEQTKKSVLIIIARKPEGEAKGTGFVVSADGKIVTNYHVIEGATGIFVKVPNGKTLGIERIVASDKRVDLAVLQVRGVSLRPLPLGDSDALKVGQEVCVMGAPLGLEHSFSTGVISAKRVMFGFEWIQITAPISPGSSGSPVMSRSAKVVGIASHGIHGDLHAQNLNFASPVKYLRMLLNRRPIRPASQNAPRFHKAPATPRQPPSSLLVTNATELVQAVAEVKEGGEIALQPGEYRLREPLVINKSLSIVGVGYKQTRLVFEGKCIQAKNEPQCGGIKFVGNGLLSIRDVSVRYSGAGAGCNVILATQGDLRLTRCFISGGIGEDEQNRTIGGGVTICGTANAVISECIIADNKVGIGIQEQARARIELCEVFSNEIGVATTHTSSCEVRHSEVSGNDLAGIIATAESRLIARNNTCEKNDLCGIALGGSAQGELQANTCRQNRIGIAAGEQSRLTARNNTCEKNEDCGIKLVGSAQGELQANTCRQNRIGIAATDQSRLTARTNLCRENALSGIYVGDTAFGELEANLCAENKGYGIFYVIPAVVFLKNNVCYDNPEGNISGARK